MKFRVFPAVLLMIGCLNNNSNSDATDQSHCSKLLFESKSPDGRKNLTLTEIGYDSLNFYTQVVVDFGTSGSGVYATNGNNLGIKTYWKNNSTIVIETAKAYKASQKWETVQSFGEKVKVEYNDF